MIVVLPAGTAEPYKFNGSKVAPLLEKDLRSKDRLRFSVVWIEQLMSRVRSCWHQPNDVSRADDIEARVEVEFKPDGSLAGEPSVVAVTKHPLGDAFAQSTVKAIKDCQPYSFLPAEQYKGGWDKLDMTFSTDSDAKRARDRALNDEITRRIKEQMKKPEPSKPE